MARTESTMLPLGTQAPYFKLLNTANQTIYTFDEHSLGKPALIMFICNHCPYVKHINKSLVSLSQEYLKKGFIIVAINSNDEKNYPEDSPENMANCAKTLGYPFPYLFDDTQDIAKSYHAACTPDFFLFDKTHHLVYRGQLDDSRPGNNIPSTGASLRQAMEQLLNGQPITELQKPSLGCNIKWK